MAQRLQDMAAAMALWNATIAHELRTPLTILKGRLQGMIDGVFEPDEHALQALVLQVDGLARLVEDLRTVTLADSGHLDLRIEPIRLARQIEQMAELMVHDLRAAGFHLQLELADLTVEADATRIRQALLALVTNARRYAIRGAITITLTARDEYGRARRRRRGARVITGDDARHLRSLCARRPGAVAGTGW
ncbi:MAG TPA: histidine kinase dimerization/phospho-acceptor domain-containing protein [Kaistia sp.]|nr:histidine kinase dimerization/phospho-acceptor domain-containing protein [Kaistia sp.]